MLVLYALGKPISFAALQLIYYESLILSRASDTIFGYWPHRITFVAGFSFYVGVLGGS